MKPKICKQCQAEIVITNRWRKVNKFCSYSCAAKFNNSKRIVTDEQKRKTSNSLKNTTIIGRKCSVYFPNCNICRNPFATRLKEVRNRVCSRICQNELTRRTKLGKSNPKSKYAGKPIGRKDFEHYRSLCEFGIQKHLIQNIKGYDKLLTHKMWSVDNKSGVVRDHLYSVKEGWLNNVPPEIIKHPANCQFITQIENSKKCDRSEITLNELRNRINTWNQFIATDFIH